MTASTDFGAAVDAMNRGHLFRLVQKPWKGEGLMSALTDGVEEYADRILIATGGIRSGPFPRHRRFRPPSSAGNPADVSEPAHQSVHRD